MFSPLSRRSGIWFESIQTEIKVAIPSESLTLSEQTPITSPLYASVPNTSLSLTEQAITLRYQVPIDSSELSLNEQTPTYQLQVAIPNEALTLTANNLAIPQYYHVPAISLTLDYTGFSLVSEFDIPVANLALNAYAPTYVIPEWNAYSNLYLPSPIVTITANDKDNARASLTLPAPTLTIETGAITNAALPSLLLTATATSPGYATAAVELPAPELTATVIVGELATVAAQLPTPEISAQCGAYASLELLAPQLTATGDVGHLAQVVLTLPFLELTAEITVGVVATVTLELPTLEIAATGSVGGVSAVSLTLPALILTAASAGVVSESTYAINLNTGAVTNLLLGEFDKLVTAHGRLYGLRNGQLVKLDGATDNGAAIPATIRFAPQTFGTNRTKRISDVYLSSREDDGVDLTLVADELHEWRYRTPTDTAPAYGTHKVKVGRGIKFHTAGVILQNRNGGRLDVGGMEVLVDGLSPRPKT